MSTVREEKEGVIAILCSDFHLSLNPPIFRSAEPDWFAAMKRPLDEIKELQSRFGCPVICAGDIFDRWNSPPELINFAYDNLPEMYAIPGQHDLPLHNYDDIKKSAYQCLTSAKIIRNMQPNRETSIEFADTILYSEGPKFVDLLVFSFPYGFPVKPCQPREDLISIAVVHEYICTPGHAYPGAPQESYIPHIQCKKDCIFKQYEGYDIVVFGDNHDGFHVSYPKVEMFNCGTIMKRKSDEIDYKPQVGLVFADGRIEGWDLDTSKDKYLEIQDTTKTTLDMKGFIKELEKLGDTDLDFYEAMKQYLKKNKISDAVCNIILEGMGL